MMDRVCQWEVSSVGEALVRLSTPPGERLETVGSLRVDVAGSEANVLAALSALGRGTALVTGLPENPVGRLVFRHLRAAGLNLDRTVWSRSGRVGTYFVEAGQPPRATRVLYDRLGSCASHLEPDAIDWDYLTSSRIVHMTGITPAISRGCFEIVREVRRRAYSNSLPVSFDINYRQGLWGVQEARTALDELCREVEILFCSRSDAQRVFGLSGEPGDVARLLGNQTGARAVVVSDGPRTTTMWREAGCTAVLPPRVQTVDRLGAGDALAAGVLDGWLDGDIERGLHQGTLLAAVALGQTGDMLAVTRPELHDLLTSPGWDVFR